MDLLIDTVRVARTRADLALRPGEVLLAGGSWLFSEPQHARGTTGLVDLTTLGWPALTGTAEGLSIAATCTVAEIHAITPALVGAAHPLFAQCCDALLASWKVWNTATVGGNICLALPAGAMTALAVTLDATAVVWLPDDGQRTERTGAERTLPVSDLVTGPGRTALAPGEVLRSLEIPRAALGARTASRQIALSPLGRSGALVTGRRDPDGATTIVVTASTPAPVVLRFPAPPAPPELSAVVAGIEHSFDDVHGAPDWRRQVTTVLAEEVRAELADDTGPGDA